MKIVLSNAPPDRAVDIARTLIEERRAACINLLPIRSIYRWEGRVCDDPETTLLIKVATEGLEALIVRLRALHPYEVPEILVLPVEVEASFAPYVQWVRHETRVGMTPDRDDAP